jgi:hypothetical protein
MENPMKKLFFAALAALSLGAAVVPAVVPAVAATLHDGSTVAGDTQATRMQQTGSYTP